MFVNFLVLSSLEFCSSLYLNLALILLNKLQAVIDASLKSIHCLRKFVPFSDLHRQNGILSIKQRIHRRTCFIIFTALQLQCPFYIQQFLISISNSRHLRSHDMNLLECARVTTSMAIRVFSVSDPQFWNSLPVHVRQCSALSQLLVLVESQPQCPTSSLIVCLSVSVMPASLFSYMIRVSQDMSNTNK